MIADGDKCPKCGNLQLPKWVVGSKANARMCQGKGCNYTEGRNGKELEKK